MDEQGYSPRLEAIKVVMKLWLDELEQADPEYKAAALHVLLKMGARADNLMDAEGIIAGLLDWLDKGDEGAGDTLRARLNEWESKFTPGID